MYSPIGSSIILPAPIWTHMVPYGFTGSIIGFLLIRSFMVFYDLEKYHMVRSYSWQTIVHFIQNYSLKGAAVINPDFRRCSTANAGELALIISKPNLTPHHHTNNFRLKDAVRL